jgi:hypothetical protein
MEAHDDDMPAQASGGSTPTAGGPRPDPRGTPRTRYALGSLPAAAPAPTPSPGFGLRSAWPALTLYAGMRSVAVLVLWFAATARGRNLGSVLGAWDGLHYVHIATHGYPAGLVNPTGGGLFDYDFAFFPLYPGLIAVLNPVLPGGARSAAILVSWAAGPVAAWGLYAVGACLRDRRTGVVLAGLWAVVPHAVVQSMAYTETLFTALAAWSLLALLRRQWLTAGVLCLLAGLTRSTAVALVAAVGLAALIAVCRRRDGWRPWLAGMLAPLGWLGYVAWVGHRLGRADGYLYVQKAGWQVSYDFGRYTLANLTYTLTHQRQLGFYATTAVLVVALALLILLVVDRTAWPLVVYTAVMFVAVVGYTGYYHVKARHLLPAFPLLLPVAYGLAAARRSRIVVVFLLLTSMSTWYGVYLCLIWAGSP